MSLCVCEREKAPLTTTRALRHSHISEGQQYRHVHLVSRHGVVEVVEVMCTAFHTDVFTNIFLFLDTVTKISPKTSGSPC